MLVNILQSVKDWANNMFVKLTGGTVTGAINFKNDDLDRDGEAPSAIVYGQTMPVLVDKDGETLGYVQPSIDANGISRLQLTAVNESNGTPAYASLIVMRDRDSSALGEVWTNCWMSVNTRLVARANSDNYAAINFQGLNRSSDVIRLYGAPDANGDGMVINTGGLFIAGSGESPGAWYSRIIGTDDLTFKNYAPGSEQTFITSDNEINLVTNAQTIANRRFFQFAANGIYSKMASNSPIVIGNTSNNGATATTSIGELRFDDKNGNWSTVLGSQAYASGEIRTYIGTRNIKTDGTAANNWFNMSVAKNGSATYSVTSPANFRSAIAAANQPTQLYNNADGATGTVTLSATAANYNHMRIYFYGKGGSSKDWKRHASVDVYTPNGKVVSLSVSTPINSGYNGVVIHTKVVTISAKSIASTKYYSANIDTGTGSAASNEIYIVRVEGWNE